ncbi:putative fatty acyl-CoA reductase CG8306 [Myzus persicae]|uniref:putative fatty acyl-CoA reductase CG8306 n=1 Tax=Myzus persicae TaxID=13164 RepID=UPI000B93351A|nr:putative fatty acyl-CoA reductase CG8306 [Myzus persicae]XP_022166924.1 putative fatty acyl-CoA reductase CG8306 [Myzus persicae]XP_022166925.1 putative fatty acyl-CoA reductase CG8306 [Myzus persicae]XP_022166926.1 putative fatty acyl-CoA reductase CG8306 [Myzus persicae]XP_022166927.1 putative fatty acyl-CoA reductase CG8306 [Myzus persicae]
MTYETVKTFYTNKNIFLTGGSGFVGVSYIEKVLRSMPNVGSIFVLLRPRKGQGIQERLDTMKNNSVFDVIKTSDGFDELLSKIKPVCGDISEENLGLSDDDFKMLCDNVNIVVHCAATLDFETDLKTAVTVNLLGTKRIVELSKKIKNLQCLLHVSSAYVNSNKNYAMEKIYDAPANYNDIINYTQTTDTEKLNSGAEKIMGDHINTYTFTKALAEHVVNDARNIIRTCIVRPSMIVAAWKEPVEGWTVSKNGPQGFIMGASKGVVRRLPVNKSLIYDYIPVDVVINTMIASTWFSAQLPDSTPTVDGQTPIFHCTTSTCNPFRWNDISSILTTTLHNYPIRGAVWYPNIKFLPNLFMYWISSAIFHFIPAYILDFVTKISGGRPILVRLHKNVNRSLSKLAPFIFNEWKFDNARTLRLQEELSVDDQSVFYIDPTSLNWTPYFINLTLGVRKYLHKESDKTMKQALKKNFFLMLANTGVQLLAVTGIWYLSSFITGTPFLSNYWAALIVIIFGYIF